MQRHEEAGVVISCDFCGTDWDQVQPMLEGHHGSVLCLGCFKVALEAAEAQPGEYACTLCLRDRLPPTLPRWRGRRREAVVCHDCILQAAKVFDRDDDVDWRWHKPRE